MSEVLKEEIRDEKWLPENDQDAEWCIQQIRNAQAEKETWNQFYKEQNRKVEEACDLTIHNMEAMLESYFGVVPHKATKTQESYQLPSGKLIRKIQGPEFDRDDQKIIEWLKANGLDQYIKTKITETLDWSALKAACSIIGESLITEDGEVVPDIRVIQRPDIFKVDI